MVEDELDDWDDGIELKIRKDVSKTNWDIDEPKKKTKEVERDTLGFLKKAEN